MDNITLRIFNSVQEKIYFNLYTHSVDNEIIGKMWLIRNDILIHLRSIANVRDGLMRNLGHK